MPDYRCRAAARSPARPPRPVPAEMSHHILAVMSPVLANLINQLDAADLEAANLIAGLTEAQARWQPAPSRWSIVLCLEHLATSAEMDNGGFERALQKRQALRRLARARHRRLHEPMAGEKHRAATPRPHQNRSRLHGQLQHARSRSHDPLPRRAPGQPRTHPSRRRPRPQPHEPRQPGNLPLQPRRRLRHLHRPCPPPLVASPSSARASGVSPIAAARYTEVACRFSALGEWWNGRHSRLKICRPHRS